VSHYLLSRHETVQTVKLCRPDCYCDGGGRPITSCHVPQQFKPLGCVAPVVTVRVPGVPSPPVTSPNSSNGGLYRPGGYCEGCGRPTSSCHVPQQLNRGLGRPGGYCECVGPSITSCQVPQQFKPLCSVAPVVSVRVSNVPSHLATSRNISNRYAVSPRWLLLGWRASHHLLSRPARVQTATLCRPEGYCEGFGRPITSCHVPQKFKPLGRVAHVVTVSTVRVSDVSSPPVTSRNSTNRYALTRRWLL
jgi:hypothetical protein